MAKPDTRKSIDLAAEAGQIIADTLKLDETKESPEMVAAIAELYKAVVNSNYL
ncbi:hypothetical protein [uncultured Secundilactobacillus sp.]|uniref:hypothetical protein n=1 Tax=uncultured Secundilactobacillus sp. TaxID=2813935 RepID=UPI002585D357|nr:hypothetical protein [uncultured Secundilactobacillus sp.]